MKTKKFIQALTALALCATMTAPVNAFAAGDINPGHASTITDNVDTARTGETDLIMNVESEYTVTIPETVTLFDNGTTAGGGEWGTKFSIRVITQELLFSTSK